MESAQGYRLTEIVANYRSRTELPSYVLAVEWFERAFRALAAIHASGRLHRSIGPDAIFIGGDDEVSLEESGGATSWTPGGSANYASPEEQSGGTVDQRSDVYRLGAVFYELLTLNLPGAFLDPPSRINLTVPKGFDAIVLRTLARDPEARYATADDVLADLAAFRRSPAARILPYGSAPAGHSVRPAGVPRAAMIAAGAILGAIVGAVAGALLHSILPVTIVVGAVVGGAVGAFAKSNP